MSITQEEWCWKHKSVEIDVLDSYVEGVEFRQTGYLLRCSLSHAITLVRTENIQYLKMSDHIVTRISCYKPKMVMLMIMHFVHNARNFSKMAAHQRTLAFTICPKESIASVYPSQVNSAFPSVLEVH